MADTPTPTDSEPQGSAKSPFAGCSILIVATIVMVALVGWALWTLRFQEGEIAKFTQEEPQPVPVYDVKDRPDEVATFQERLERFQTNISEKKDAKLRLTVDDINLAIAHYESFQEFRETFYVREIADDLLHIDISYKLGDAPFSGRKNYLNGQMTAILELVPREVVMRIQEIDIPEGEMPKEFLTELSTHRIMEVYKEHDILGPVMNQLTSVTIEGNAVVAAVTQGEKPPTDIPEDMTGAGQRVLALVGILATLFLTAVGILLYSASKKKAQTNSES